MNPIRRRRRRRGTGELTRHRRTPARPLRSRRGAGPDQPAVRLYGWRDREVIWNRISRQSRKFSSGQASACSTARLAASADGIVRSSASRCSCRTACRMIATRGVLGAWPFPVAVAGRCHSGGRRACGGGGGSAGWLCRSGPCSPPSHTPAPHFPPGSQRDHAGDCSAITCRRPAAGPSAYSRWATPPRPP